MSGIRTNAAAELLGVSPNTLRSWERRFGYPTPRRTAGGHRQYDLAELEALRRALLETHNISSAIQVAQQRGEGPSSASRLLEAFDRFDDAAGRSPHGGVAVAALGRAHRRGAAAARRSSSPSEREGREAEYEFACRWATGWLHAARRVAPPATRDEGVLLFDASSGLTAEALQVQALELALRRAGFRVLLLSIGLAQERVSRAMRALDPDTLVLCGNGRDARRRRPARLRRAPARVGGTAVRVPRFDAGHRLAHDPVARPVADRGHADAEDAGRRRQTTRGRRRAARCRAVAR